MSLLVVQELMVRRGGALALHGVGLRVAPGETVALLGANGAGKSTLLRAVMGLERAEGRVAFAGRALGAMGASRRARLGIGYCPEGRRVFAGLSVVENLVVACWAGRAERARRVAAVFEAFPALAERRGVAAWTLSGGQQQMLAIGRALMGAPRLLLLDEPSLGLSPKLAEAVLGRLPALAAGGMAVLLAEQNARRALAVCVRGVVLRLGTVAAEGPAEALARSEGLADAFLGV